MCEYVKVKVKLLDHTMHTRNGLGHVSRYYCAHSTYLCSAADLLLQYMKLLKSLTIHDLMAASAFIIRISWKAIMNGLDNDDIHRCSKTHI